MRKPRCIATIKYTKQEVELHINALKTFINNDSSRAYAGPYKKLLKDMQKIKSQMLEKENNALINRETLEPILSGNVCQE